MATNEEDIISNYFYKKKYNFTTSNPEDEEEKIVEFFKKHEVKEEPNSWLGKGFDVVSNFLSGNKKEEFPNMKELGSAKVDLVDGIKLGTGFLININKEAQVDMIRAVYPTAIISKDKFDNIVVTLPEDAVQKGQNRTFYLNKPGLTTKDVTETVGQVLQYIPGAGWVYKKVGGGIFKHIAFQGLAAAGTGVVQDVASLGFSSKHGEGGVIPKFLGGNIIEEDKLALNLVAGAGGEAFGRFLQRYNFVNNAIKFFVPSKFNITSGSGLFLNNKGIVTDKTKSLAKKHFEDLSLLNNNKILKEYAQALEDGVSAADAVHLVGANEYGISLWKAQASGNTKVMKYIKDAENGVYGEPVQAIVRQQKLLQLNQTFDYLTKFRSNLIRNKKTQPPETTLPGQKTKWEQNIESIDDLIQTTKLQMDEVVDAKYSAVDWTGKIKAPVVNNLTKNIKLAISGSDGLGQNINKITMPQAWSALKQIDRVAKNIKNLKVNKISIDLLENQRKNLNTILKTVKDPTDKKALMVIKNQFDLFYDKTINGALATGDTTLLKQIKLARAESSKVKSIFNPNNIGKTKDVGGTLLNEILNGKYNALQINNILYGNSTMSIANASKSQAILERLTKTIFKPGTEGFDLLVDGASQRIINNSFRTIGGNQIFDPKLFLKEVQQMINGNGKGISKILFNKQQQKDLLGFAKQLEKTTDINTFKNVDIGAKKFTNLFQSGFRAIAGIFGFQAFGIQGTLASRFIYDELTDINNYKKGIEDIADAIAFSKIKQASGGQGIIQSVYQNQNILGIKDQNKDQATILEQKGIIESLNKYR